MISTEERTIWTSDVYDEDYFAELQENYPDLSEDDIWQIAIDGNNDVLDEIKANLSDIYYPNQIIIIGNIGRWDGPVNGIKTLDGNLSDCFQSFVQGDSEITFTYKAKDLYATEKHHDGTNYYRFRAFRDNITETQKDNFIHKVCTGTVTEHDIVYYTKTVMPKSVLNILF